MDIRIRATSLIAITAIAIAVAPLTGAAVQSGFRLGQKARSAYVPGEVLVKFRSGTSTQSKSDFAASFATASPKKLLTPNLTLVKLGSGQTVHQAIQSMKGDSRIEYVQPNYMYYPEAVPTDPEFQYQWGLNNTGQLVPNATYNTAGIAGTPGDDISAELAWDHITDCSPVIVAVVDEGINYTQKDLTGNMWNGSASGYPNHGWDFVGKDDGTGTETGVGGVGDNDPMPVYGNEQHGTHVAGIIAAAANNSYDGTGVCWKAQIMSVRALTPTGGTSAEISNAITFAAKNGAKVINMSLGGPNKDTAISDAITTAENHDAVVVIAAGNSGGNNDVSATSGGTPTYPCDDTQPNIICVAALDQNFNLASFSDYGATSVDVGAPGTDIISTFPGPVTTDTLTTGWTAAPATGGWAETTCLLTSGASINVLADPTGLCSGSSYSATAKDDIYKSFNVNGALAATASYYLAWDLAPATATNGNVNDTFSSAADTATGDPFASGTATTLRTIPDGSANATGSSTTSGQFYGLNDTLPASCLTSPTCTLGFNLTSNNTDTAGGVAVAGFEIDTLTSGGTDFGIMSGTSMATPMVSGIAAMVRSYNPNYTYADTIAAIENGGTPTASLSGTTTSGNAANAMGALAYITTPTGIKFSVQ